MKSSWTYLRNSDPHRLHSEFICKISRGGNFLQSLQKWLGWLDIVMAHGVSTLLMQMVCDMGWCRCPGCMKTDPHWQRSSNSGRRSWMGTWKYSSCWMDCISSSYPPMYGMQLKEVTFMWWALVLAILFSCVEHYSAFVWICHAWRSMAEQVLSCIECLLVVAIMIPVLLLFHVYLYAEWEFNSILPPFSHRRYLKDCWPLL